MAMLKLAMDEPQLRLHACNVWKTFIDSLPLQYIGPSLSQIVVQLLPYVTRETRDEIADKICALLNDLIVHRRSSLRGYFKTIPVLPSLPVLEQVSRVV